MSAPQFAAEMNALYFDGRLAPEVVERLSRLPTDRDDVRAFIERMCRSMMAAHFPAADFSVLQGEILAGLLSRLLPGNWEGRVPPITIAERHSKLDLLVAHAAATDGLPRTFIDIACGFPPLTTIDTATALADWQVTGIDRSLPEYLLHDADGNYAVFDAQGRAVYFQPLVPSPLNWEALVADWEGSRQRFETLLTEMLAERARSGGGDRVERHGVRLEVNPVQVHSHERLTFIRADLADARVALAGAVRCCNMLMYFDREFRRNALAQLSALVAPNGLLICGSDWVHTTEARYFTFRKRGGQLSEAEFAFSLDNLTPLGIISWYTLHDDDLEIELLADFAGRLRSDRRFMRDFRAYSDALRAESNLVPRGPDGYYATSLPTESPDELGRLGAAYGERLSEEFGGRAVRTLRDQGLDARLNPVGHVAVKVPVA